MDTIFALASARGRAGVSVLRLSGPLAWQAVQSLCHLPLPAPRRAALRALYRGDMLLDQALVLLFAKGASFTGEDVAELHLHGAIATVNAVLAALADHPGLRLAEAGEFTRRALENGCLDLAQVEGLSDLIEAETESQRKQALRVLSGAVGRRAEAWRAQLIRAAALIEATIDFADEDVPVDVTPEVTQLLQSVMGELRAEAAGAQVSERIRDGFEVAIVGLPNAGKSTLLNALAGREAAITSDIAGTTRDVIEVRMDLAGLAVTLLDTAGLRQAEDRIEAIGIERALERARAADLRVFLIADDGLPQGLKPLADDIVLRGKHDDADDTGQGVSGRTGAGLTALIGRITAVLEQRASGAAIVTRERHRLALIRAVEALESAQNEVWIGADRAELAAEDMRRAIRALDSLVGRVDVEHLLGEIFSSFCIGK